MKKTVLLTIISILLFGFPYGQKSKSKSKEILIEKIISILSPVNGKEKQSDLSYSSELFKKYGIKSFEFYKINILDGSDCNFNYFDGEDYLPQSLNIGDYYSGLIYNADKTIYVRAQYTKYLRNEKNPISSKAEVVYYVYK